MDLIQRLRRHSASFGIADDVRADTEDAANALERSWGVHVPEVPTLNRTLARLIVDLTWQHAMEGPYVPSTDVADNIINAALLQFASASTE